MHEWSIATALVEQIRQCQAREGFATVRRVDVAVGVMSGVDARALAFCFPMALEGTPFVGACLSWEELPVRLHCRECGEEMETMEPCLMPCRACASGQVEIVAGEDLMLRSLEVN